MKTRLEREVSRNKIDKPKNYKTFDINKIASNLYSKKSIFVVDNFIVPNLVNCKELYVFASDRINFFGPNGPGKTTFIKSIFGLNDKYLGKIEIGNDVKIGYFSQEHEVLDVTETVLDNFLERTPIASEMNARKILGSFLFRNDKIFSRVSLLSEGEKARLIFAILITQKNDFLLLDEPTNHLDLESREILEKSLLDYEGGFLVVSHDRYFVKNIKINRRLVIKEGVISEI